MNRSDLAGALADRNVQAFLRVIREGESCQEPDAYWWLYGSTRTAPKLAQDLADHPRVKTFEAYDGQFIRNGRIDYTTAAGAYQITATTWDTVVQPALALPDFRPDSQDAAAVYLLAHRRALDHVVHGRLDEAFAALRDEWASMPGAVHGDQPTQAYTRAVSVFTRYGGTINAPAPAVGPATGWAGGEAATAQPDAGAPSMPAGEAPDWTPPPAQETPAMAPILAGFGKSIILNALPAIVQAIPRLGSLFATSEQAQKNVKALEVVTQVAADAIGASNAQQLVEGLQDADKAAAARNVVDNNWARILDMTEAGSGGIDGARKADKAITGERTFLWSPSFWMGVLLLPIVYLIVLNVIGVLGTAQWSPEARAGLAGMLSGTIVGGLVGYYYGQTTSRNRAAP